MTAGACLSLSSVRGAPTAAQPPLWMVSPGSQILRKQSWRHRLRVGRFLPAEALSVSPGRWWKRVICPSEEARRRLNGVTCRSSIRSETTVTVLGHKTHELCSAVRLPDVCWVPAPRASSLAGITGPKEQGWALSSCLSLWEGFVHLQLV